MLLRKMMWLSLGEWHRGVALDMEKQYPPYPALRICTFGDMRIERLVRFSICEDYSPTYERIERGSWSNRGPALTMLKILLCCDGRRASKDVLIDALWNEDTQQ